MARGAHTPLPLRCFRVLRRALGSESMIDLDASAEAEHVEARESTKRIERKPLRQW